MQRAIILVTHRNTHEQRSMLLPKHARIGHGFQKIKV